MKHFVKILLTACWMLNTVGAWAQYQQVNDIAYTEAGANAYAQERCKLDVYYPTEIEDAPVVVWFHGGGIEAGNKYIDDELKNSGLVVVAANYRLLPKASIDECLDDAAAAVAWTYKNIAKYNGSPRKIFVVGHSAGGYLLDMIGLEKKWLAKYGVDADSLAALVPFSGQCVTHYNIRKQQGLGPLQPTIDHYAPLAHLRPDAPPMIIISADRELEMNGRYEEQAYFWRMLKLVGHKDVSLYEMQGYDHGSMPHPAYHILKQHIHRLTAPKTSALPQAVVKVEEQALYPFVWQASYARHGAKVVEGTALPVLDLGANDGYYDLTPETGAMVKDIKDFSVSVYFKVGAENKLDGYGHFLFAFSKLAANKADEGPYMAMRLNEQRFETSTGGWEHESIIMQGGQPKRDVWVHVLYRQHGTTGELYLDGKLIGRNASMPVLADIFEDAPACCWIGRAPFDGDKYLTHTQVADFRLYNYAVSDKELKMLTRNKTSLK